MEDALRAARGAIDIAKPAGHPLGVPLPYTNGPFSETLPTSDNFLRLFFEHHPQQQAAPGAVGTPGFGNLPGLLGCREVIQTVGQGNGATQSRFVRWQSIRLSCSTQENELSGKVTDTRQGLQVLKRLFWWHRTQEGSLKLPLKRCLCELMQILDLAPKQAGKGLKLSEAGWSGESMFLPPMDLHCWSKFLSQASLDPSGLRDTDAMADECPGCRPITRSRSPTRGQSRPPMSRERMRAT
jgi:hypothetical protein